LANRKRVSEVDAWEDVVVLEREREEADLRVEEPIRGRQYNSHKLMAVHPPSYEAIELAFEDRLNEREPLSRRGVR
jgi:hypothetical protein